MMQCFIGSLTTAPSMARRCLPSQAGTWARGRVAREFGDAAKPDTADAVPALLIQPAGEVVQRPRVGRVQTCLSLPVLPQHPVRLIKRSLNRGSIRLACRSYRQCHE